MIYSSNNLEKELITISALAEESGFTTVFLDDPKKLDIAYNFLTFLNPNIKIIKLLERDSIPYDPISASPDVIIKRINALLTLSNLKNQHCILLSSHKLLLEKLLHPDDVKLCFCTLLINQNIDRNYLLNLLQEFGYNRVDIAESIGEFAVRGSIVDIVYDQGYRIDFFGNNITSIKVFDTTSQLSIKTITEVTITSISEILLNEETISAFHKNYLSTYGINDSDIYNTITAGIRAQGIENWLPFFHERLGTIFDYIPHNSAILYYDSEKINNLWESIEQRYKMRACPSEGLTTHIIEPILKPDMLYAHEHDIEIALKRHNLINRISDTYCINSVDFYTESKIKRTSPLKQLTNYLEDLAHKSQKKVIIFCSSQSGLDRIRELLQSYNVVTCHVPNINFLKNLGNGEVGITVCNMNRGIETDHYIIITEFDIFGRNLIKNTQVNQGKFLEEALTFNVGELVVHIDYGIGRFCGIKTLTVEGIIHDCIEILYYNNDKLYVPVENLDLLTKYGQDDGTQLDKLGSLTWQTRKARIKERIKLSAEKLLKIAAAREIANAPILSYSEESYEKFCAKFPYLETEDQERAIFDVKQDLLLGKPMDRLICGDVGFGKTEVAMRAAFIAASNNKQVAIITPTTLLARQHFKNFSERFLDFDLNVQQLSKFTKNSEVEGIKSGLADGTVNIVVGTHALLADNISFKDLGLVIVDEEQHFGVKQKEKIKAFKTDAHILTLSATPIPRTLQMSLLKIKELSIIATPPINREPIKTFFIPYDHVIIREAILREYNRGGGVFYVTPRISNLEELTKSITELVPEIKVQTAHGRMSAVQLDKIMNDFYDRKFHVLISTSIVESGLDIPTCNTLIVDRADMFGLAQLYQIRGRIGRGNIHAYAYLTVPSATKISHTAKTRLNIIQNLNKLGSGFSIASHDMDIRGYGNLVGDEQSGHIKEVGIELYQKMLTDAVIALNSQEAQVYENWSPTLNLNLPVQIPESYIQDTTLRLNLYRQIAEISETSKLESLVVEMIDRFGPIPQETENLVILVKLKQLAKLAGIAKIDVGEKGIVLNFKTAPNNPDKIIDMLQSNQMKFKGDNKLLFFFQKNLCQKTIDSNKEQLKKIQSLEDLLYKLV